MLGAMNGHLELVRLIVQARAALHLQDAKGSTALMLSARNGFSDICELLLEQKASVNALNLRQETALHLASRMGQHLNVCSRKGVSAAQPNAP